MSEGACVRCGGGTKLYGGRHRFEDDCIFSLKQQLAEERKRVDRLESTVKSLVDSLRRVNGCSWGFPF